MASEQQWGSVFTHQFMPSGLLVLYHMPKPVTAIYSPYLSAPGLEIVPWQVFLYWHHRDSLRRAALLIGKVQSRGTEVTLTGGPAILLHSSLPPACWKHADASAQGWCRKLSWENYCENFHACLPAPFCHPALEGPVSPPPPFFFLIPFWEAQVRFLTWPLTWMLSSRERQVSLDLSRSSTSCGAAPKSTTGEPLLKRFFLLGSSVHISAFTASRRLQFGFLKPRAFSFVTEGLHKLKWRNEEGIYIGNAMLLGFETQFSDVNQEVVLLH